MLVLSRRRREAIVINPGKPDEVRIEITDIGGDRVSLGFTASQETVIHRAEVVAEIRRKGGK